MQDDLVLGRQGPLPSTRTDDDGRFKLSGAGRDRLVVLAVEGSSIVQTMAMVLTTSDTRYEPVLLPDAGPDGSGVRKILGPQFELTAAPGRAIEGVAHDFETGQPIAGVKIESSSLGLVTTGADGRYRLTSQPKGAENTVTAELPGQPYLKIVKSVPDSPGLGPIALNLSFNKGLWIEGRVVDKVSGQPVRGVVRYYPLASNPYLDKVDSYSIFNNNVSDEAEFPTDSGGRFRAVGLPGPALVAVRALNPGYIASSIVNQELAAKVANPDIFRAYMYNFQALFPINPPRGPASYQCELTLEPGRKQAVMIVGPNEKPVAGTMVYGLDGWGQTPKPVAGAEFEHVHPAPGKPETLLVVHPGMHLGGFTEVRGDEQGPIQVRLQPTSVVTGRLVDEECRPRPSVQLSLSYERRDGRTGENWTELFPNQGATDRDGRFLIDSLVTGVQYQLQAINANERNYSLRSEGYLHHLHWTIQPGETQDWGDVQVNKKRRLGRPSGNNSSPS